MVVGALIVKHMVNLGDEKTIQAIQENPYMQYLLGLSKFTEKPVFVPRVVAKTEHSHPLGMVVSTHFRCGKGVKRGLKNGALPFNID